MDPVTIAAAAAIGGGVGFLSGKKAKRDPYGTLNPEQRGLAQALGPYYNQTLAAGPQRYSGELVAPMGDMELDALTRSQALIGQTGQSLASLQNFQNYDQLFRDEVETPTMDFWKREIQPTLEEALPTFSTARAGVLSRNLLGVGEQLAQQRWKGRLDARNQALTAAGYAPGVSQEMTRAASVPREIEQAGLNKAYLDYTQANAEYANSINQMLQFLGISTVTQTPDTRWQNAIAGALGGAQIGLGMAGSGGTGSAGATTGYQSTIPSYQESGFSLRGSQK